MNNSVEFQNKSSMKHEIMDSNHFVHCLKDNKKTKNRERRKKNTTTLKNNICKSLYLFELLLLLPVDFLLNCPWRLKIQ